MRRSVCTRVVNGKEGEGVGREGRGRQGGEGLFCKLCMCVVNVWCFGVYGWTFALVYVRHTCMYQRSCLMFLAIWCRSLYLYWKILCSFSLLLSSALFFQFVSVISSVLLVCRCHQLCSFSLSLSSALFF